MGLVYSLRDGFSDKMQLGNKGGNLVVMASMGLPVPPAFVISIDAYAHWRQGGLLPEEEIKQALQQLEQQMGRRLGQGLEVSVRSSAPVSMPGMMDTVLNIGDYSEMMRAIRRIFESWDNLRAVEYRRLHGISATLGTAAIVQAMVYGNRDARSGTGVVFSRNPSTGQKGLFGEYLPEAQGEDLVSGARTPQPVERLREQMPEPYQELKSIAEKLERHFCDMQDIEFTVESGTLYMLQTRSGKRSGQAAVKIAVDMVEEQIITHEEAVLRVTPDDIRGMLHKQLRSAAGYRPLAHGLNAAPGAARGKVVFTPLEAVDMSRKGLPIILVRPETSPDDIQGIAAADGVLTQKGGLTSHAAIVTRAMGKPCVAGAESLNIDLGAKQFSVDGYVIKQGDEITIDGTSGDVYFGMLPLEDANLSAEFNELMGWADGFRRLGVRANADTPAMITEARRLGAEGIGLCRTERMFNAPERLSVIREFILAENATMRTAALDRLRRLQTEDFIALFKALGDVPIIVRLLDMPLHEFLPHRDTVADAHTRQRIAELEETNPMLGHRGVRLAVTSPDLYKMQYEAIRQAIEQVPEAKVALMIPQVITSQEAINVKNALGCVELRLGVMIETVRSCMRAGRLARSADFFSFGTNDLTQAVFSFSREDAEKKFLTTYLERGILEDNPFEVLDVRGVGRLMETAIFFARRARKDIEIGVCGEHAGEPRSIRYLHTTGVNYVSCSPFRVPVARLVAAQAALEGRPSQVANGSPA